MSATASAKTALARTLNALGVTSTLLAARRRSPVILRYHRVHPDGFEPPYELGISRSVFEAQLDYLSRECAPVSLEELRVGLFEGRRLPERAVALTFDDGYRDNYTEALPALRARRLPATVFVTAGHLDSGRRFWWDELAGAAFAAASGRYAIDLGRGPQEVRLDGASSRRQLVDEVCARVKKLPHGEAQAWLSSVSGTLGGAPAEDRSVLSWREVREMADAGVEIGSHTLDHPVLSRLEPEEAERQVVASRRLIEERLSRPVRFFAYPNGTREDFTPRVEQAVRRAGYLAALTTIEGRPRPMSDPLKLERIAVSAGMCTDRDGRFCEALFASEIAGIMGALLMRGSRRAH